MAREVLLCSLLVILSVESVFCGDDCITYSIDEKYDSVFTAAEGGLCTSLDNEWILSFYTADVTPPNNRSSMYISPQLKISDHVWSCVRSFTFPMSDNGVVELNIFTENLQINVDRVMVTVQVEAGGTFRCVLHSELESGWKTIRIPLSLPSGTFQGYVSIDLEELSINYVM